MKIKIILLGIFMALICPTIKGQKIAVSYSFRPHFPIGAEIHYFIPKTDFGLYAGLNAHLKNKQYDSKDYFKQDGFTAEEAKNHVDLYTKSNWYVEGSGKYNMVSSGTVWSAGVFYRPVPKLMISLGMGTYKAGFFSTVRKKTAPGDAVVPPYYILFVHKDVQLVNVHTGISYLLNNRYRIGFGYDIMPKLFNFSIGYAFGK